MGDEKPTPEYYTVIYQVTGDRAKHDEWWQSLQPIFMADGPISITGVAKFDALDKLEQMRKLNAQKPDY